MFYSPREERLSLFIVVFGGRESGFSRFAQFPVVYDVAVICFTAHRTMPELSRDVQKSFAALAGQYEQPVRASGGLCHGGHR
jgi:hypothetical protein